MLHQNVNTNINSNRGNNPHNKIYIHNRQNRKRDYRHCQTNGNILGRGYYNITHNDTKYSQLYV